LPFFRNETFSGELEEKQLCAIFVNLCANMEGGLSYNELRNMPLRELEIVASQVNKIVERRNAEMKRSTR